MRRRTIAGGLTLLVISAASCTAVPSAEPAQPTVEARQTQVTSGLESSVAAAWKAVGSLVKSHDGAKFFSHNGFIFLTGPDNGVLEYQRASLPDLEFTVLQMPGNCPLFGLKAYQLAQAFDESTGTLYVSGGITRFDSSRNFICSAQVRNDEIGQWRIEPDMSEGRFSHSMVAHNKTLYVLGGAGANYDFLNSVEGYRINNDGTLEKLGVLGHTNLPRPETAAFAVVTGNGKSYLYSAGGGRHDYITNSIERAEIMPDGSLGDWRIVGGLPTELSYSTAVVANDKVLLIGGHTKEFGAGVTNQTFIATINPDGISGFQPYESLKILARNPHALALGMNGVII